MNSKLQEIKNFVNKWKGKGHEKQDTHPFWEELVECLLDVKHGRDVLNWEKDVPIPVITTEDGKTTKYIDCYLETSKCVPPSEVNIIREMALTQFNLHYLK